MPAGLPPTNERLLDRLPSDPRADLYPSLQLRGVIRGDWALSNEDWYQNAAGWIGCTGAAPEALWMGAGRLVDSEAYWVFAFEVDGWTGEQLLALWREKMLTDDPRLIAAVREGRHYLIGRGDLTAAVYVAGPTFYIIRPFCCVEPPAPGSSPGPTSEQLIEVLIGMLPRH